MQRLTVHVEKVKTKTIEVKTKDGTKNVKKTFNTLSFKNVNEKNAHEILKRIQKDKLGIPTKWYLSY